MLDSSNPAAAMGLSIVYQLGMSMVLMNLLIGVMCNSMAQAVQYEDIKGLLSRAQVLDELDTVVPDWLERLMPHNYPKFVVRRWEGLGYKRSHPLWPVVQSRNLLVHDRACSHLCVAARAAPGPQVAGGTSRRQRNVGP